jgi:hypothetical protein
MSQQDRHQGDRMSNTQIELTKVIESLLSQMSQQFSQQAQKIAMLEATVDALLKNANSEKPTEQ